MSSLNHLMITLQTKMSGIRLLNILVTLIVVRDSQQVQSAPTSSSTPEATATSTTFNPSVLKICFKRPINITELELALKDIATANDIDEQKDGNGSNCLMRAARRGREDVVKLLIKHNANLDLLGFLRKEDKVKRTALHIAVVNKHREVVYVLLVAGARTDITDRRGRTPAELARSRGKTDIADIIDKFADVTATTEGTPTTVATDPCESNPCGPGRCEQFDKDIIEGGFICHCGGTGFRGQYCQIELPPEVNSMSTVPPSEDPFYDDRAFGYFGSAAAILTMFILMVLFLFGLLDSVNYYVRLLLAARKKKRREHQEQEVIGSVEEELKKIPNRFMAKILRIIVHIGEKQIRDAVEKGQQRRGSCRLRRDKTQKNELRQRRGKPSRNEIKTQVLTRMRNAEIELTRRSAQSSPRPHSPEEQESPKEIKTVEVFGGNREQSHKSSLVSSANTFTANSEKSQRHIKIPDSSEPSESSHTSSGSGSAIDSEYHDTSWYGNIVYGTPEEITLSRMVKRWKVIDTDSISFEQEEEVVGRVTSVGKEERPKKPSQSKPTLF